MAEQAPRLKHRDNLFDKTRKVSGVPPDNKTICGFLVEPLLQAVGDLFRRAAETRTWAGRFQSNLTEC